MNHVTPFRQIYGGRKERRLLHLPTHIITPPPPPHHHPYLKTKMSFFIEPGSLPGGVGGFVQVL
jgi:hypothetical protein